MSTVPLAEQHFSQFSRHKWLHVAHSSHDNVYTMLARIQFGHTGSWVTIIKLYYDHLCSDNTSGKRVRTFLVHAMRMLDKINCARSRGPRHDDIPFALECQVWIMFARGFANKADFLPILYVQRLWIIVCDVRHVTFAIYMPTPTKLTVHQLNVEPWQRR